MGAWGPGAFDNDAAAEFLEEAAASPGRAVVATLRSIARAAAGSDVDVDDGGAAWAACELVALAFGYRNGGDPPDAALDLAAKLKPKEEHRLLAVEALARIADRATSEVAQLWHEGRDGAAFDHSVAELNARLIAAAAGPRELPRAKKNDLIAIPVEPGAAELVVVQVLGPREVAVFAGTWPDVAAALAAVGSAIAWRVCASADKLLRRGRVLANRPLRKDLRGTKLYASEASGIETYALATASGGGLRLVGYDEARGHDRRARHRVEDLVAVARGAGPVAARVRSVDEREAELASRHGASWAARRRSTTPGPFGDVARLAELLDWIETYGVANAVQRSHDEATGMQGYGRPNESSERGSYAFAGLVALWRGTLPRDVWPAELSARLPPPPPDMATALSAARVLAGQVITRDAELRLIWDGAADGGAELRSWVERLRTALA